MEASVTPRENLCRLFSGRKPRWTPMTGWADSDTVVIRPRQHPDNYATHLVADGAPIEYTSDLTEGLFGLEWVYVPVAGGATVKPGKPLIEDMNDWEEILVWPDLDSFNWKEMRWMNADYLESGAALELDILTSFWERLISLMDVSGAAMALIDEDQKEAVKAFFNRYADFLIDYIRRVNEVCPLDGVITHDDWGTQNGPFFSIETAREMIFPYLKKIVDYVHSEGMFYEQHSCGNCTQLAPLYVEAGVNLWKPQLMNDFDALLKLCKGTRLYISIEDGVARDATDEEAIAAAQKWFERYRGENAVCSMRGNHPAFKQELFRLSNEAFTK